MYANWRSYDTVTYKSTKTKVLGDVDVGVTFIFLSSPLATQKAHINGYWALDGTLNIQENEVIGGSSHAGFYARPALHE